MASRHRVPRSGLRTSWSGGAVARRGGRRRGEIPISKPTSATPSGGGARRRSRAAGSSRGRGRGVRAALRRVHGVEHAVATTSCTTALHLAVAAFGARARRRGDRARVHLGRDRQRRRATRARRRCSATSTSRPSTSTRPRSTRAVTARTVGDHARAPVRPVRRHGRGRATAAPPRPVGARGRGVRVRRAASAAATPARSASPAASRFTRASRSPPARAGWSRPRRRARRARPPPARPRRARARTCARTRRAARFDLAEYDELGFNYRMTDLQAAVGLAQLDRAAWLLAERAAWPPATPKRWATSTGCACRTCPRVRRTAGSPTSPCTPATASR